MVPNEEREFAQFFHDLFLNADAEEIGQLHIQHIKSLIVSADLVLTRVQLMAILSEAIEDEYGQVNYAEFASTVAGMLFAMFRQRNVAASDITAARASEHYSSILGHDEMSFTEQIKVSYVV